MSVINQDGFDKELARHASRAELVKRLGILFISVIVSISLAYLVGIATVNRETNLVLKDCVIPEGKCYQEGQARTAAAVTQLNDIIVLTNACTDKPLTQTIIEIRQCVLNGLEQKK